MGDTPTDIGSPHRHDAGHGRATWADLRTGRPLHVTVIDPPRYAFPLNHASNVAIPPLGVAYIAGAVEAAGHTVQVIDAVGSALTTYTSFGSIYLRGLSFDSIVERIDPSTDVLALGNMFSCQWPATRQLIIRLKDAFPNVPLVMGGEHPTGMPELTLTQAPVDVVVMGEGEETVVEVLDYFGGGAPRSLRDVRGVAFRDGAGVTQTPRRDRIVDIDTIPRPAWHHFDIEAYIGLNQPHGAALGRYIPMLATRGCPFRCTFCTSPQMWTQRWIMRDPERIVDEMETYVERYGATDFHFEDLTAIVKKEKVIALAQAILDRKLEITFQLPSGTRSEAVDAESARYLRAAGCSEFQFAPESGDERILKAIEKKVHLPRMFAAATTAMDAGITVSCNFIFGFPEDDWRSVANTYRAIIHCARLGFSGVNLNAYSPQPNTTSFNELVKAGRISGFDDHYFMSLFTFQSFFARKTSYNERFSPRVLTARVFLGFFLFSTLQFVFRPSRLYYSLRSLVQRDATNKSSTYLRSMIRETVRIVRFRRAVMAVPPGPASGLH
jgi:radical SAM superfamily enzyme YgiQ (UPF0313 family)